MGGNQFPKTRSARTGETRESLILRGSNTAIVSRKSAFSSLTSLKGTADNSAFILYMQITVDPAIELSPSPLEDYMSLFPCPAISEKRFPPRIDRPSERRSDRKTESRTKTFIVCNRRSVKRGPRLKSIRFRSSRVTGKFLGRTCVF